MVVKRNIFVPTKFLAKRKEYKKCNDFYRINTLFNRHEEQIESKKDSMKLKSDSIKIQ